MTERCGPPLLTLHSVQQRGAPARPTSLQAVLVDGWRRSPSVSKCAAQATDLAHFQQGSLLRPKLSKTALARGLSPSSSQPSVQTTQKQGADESDEPPTFTTAADGHPDKPADSPENLQFACALLISFAKKPPPPSITNLPFYLLASSFRLPRQRAREFLSKFGGVIFMTAPQTRDLAQ